MIRRIIPKPSHARKKLLPAPADVVHASPGSSYTCKAKSDEVLLSQALHLLHRKLLFSGIKWELPWQTCRKHYIDDMCGLVRECVCVCVCVRARARALVRLHFSVFLN